MSVLLHHFILQVSALESRSKYAQSKFDSLEQEIKVLTPRVETLKSSVAAEKNEIQELKKKKKHMKVNVTT